MSIFKSLFRKSSNIFVTMVNNNRFGDIFGTSANITPEQIVTSFETIPDLFIVTDYVSSQISNIPVKIVKPSGRLAPSSKLHDLIKQPNEHQNWNELIKLFFAYYELLGNGYLFGIRPNGIGDIVTKLYCLPANQTNVILQGKKELPNWMNEVSGYQVNMSGEKYFLENKDVLHKRYISLRYNDGSWIYGISKYIPGDKILNELKAIYDAKTSIIENRGALGIISNESEIPDKDESEQIKKDIKAKFGLGGAQDKFIVSTQKLSWQQMSLGVQELQLIENAKYSFEKMCQLSGFDPVLFSTEGSTFANKEIATKDFFKRVVVPKVNDFYTDLNEFLGDGYGGDLILPDWSLVDELSEDRDKLTTTLVKQIEYSIITPYKAHEILYEDVDESNPPPDEYYQKSNLKKVIDNETILEPDVITPDAVGGLVGETQNNNGNGSQT